MAQTVPGGVIRRLRRSKLGLLQKRVVIQRVRQRLVVHLLRWVNRRLPARVLWLRKCRERGARRRGIVVLGLVRTCLTRLGEQHKLRLGLLLPLGPLAQRTAQLVLEPIRLGSLDQALRRQTVLARTLVHECRLKHRACTDIVPQKLHAGVRGRPGMRLERLDKGIDRREQLVLTRHRLIEDAHVDGARTQTP